ncbi:YdiU family protein [Rhodopseudomonas sp. BR0C11]|uniref:protein adenylyltransferase SelO n=1 Tax=Rhodopseudomonas sp. BR0C11 TaxID=2269370 RepID=UPI0013E0295E|nr:YdiU family protein [Rhodopseudomonas sp. BR0C11]NEV79429.1 YdiU family protein [Rhodopseudomonas sp. BR0C11]
MTAHFPFDNSYVALPPNFFARVAPTPVAAPRLIKLNRPLAVQLGLDPDLLETPEGAAILSGNQMPETAASIAMAYAGHQFGNFVPQLGDGRAILLGEVVDRNGVRRDIQLKGAGRTPFSRMGDGRAALGPVLREYIVSEAMASLGIPTTRSLAAVLTGETVLRDPIQPGAVLTRVASSHIRVGTFQYFAARGDLDSVRALADHAIARHYPEAAQAPSPYLALLEGVIGRQADLVASWMMIGFIHGVMNTDNCSVAGETIDYGPCAFMDTFDPKTVYSSIDQFGRYAYGNQPPIALWNLTRLAECLVRLLADDDDKGIEIAQTALGGFAERFNAAYLAKLAAKLGLSTSQPDDQQLSQEFLAALAKGGADFTLAFRRLSDAAGDPSDLSEVRALFTDPAAFDEWAPRWRARIAAEPQDAATRQAAMRRVNPAYIPRNHRIEAVIRAAVDRNDFTPFEEILTVLANPFEEKAEFARYAEPPQPHERVLETFCGT